MSKLLALALIIIGSWLIYDGYSRGDSLLGRTQSGIVSLKNEIDGKGRVARPYIYYGGGALLILGGAVLIFRKP